MNPAPVSFDERYNAVAARDRRFDGQFIMAVRTTGIYCRPSCPARTPRRSNVRFYLTSFARTLQLPGGTAWFEVREERGRANHVRLRARVTELADLGLLVSRVRRLFDLDADPATIDAALSRHSELTHLVQRIPGIRVPGAADPHEMLIRAIVGQQVSVASARTSLTTFVSELGRTVEARDGEPNLLFPTMSRIAEHGHEVLRGPAARIRTITETAGALADGSLTLTTADDGAEQRAALLSRRGIGPWTADYVRMRVSGDPDVCLPGDSAVRAGAVHAGLTADPKGLFAWSSRVAPWRSYLTAHLWRATAKLDHDASRTPARPMKGQP